VGACLCVSSACSGPESNDQGVGETGEGQGPDKLDDKPIQNGEDRDKRDEISRWKARHWPQRLASLASTLSAEAACLPGPSEFVCLWNAGDQGSNGSIGHRDLTSHVISRRPSAVRRFPMTSKPAFMHHCHDGHAAL
jgi:hypothetical protein